MRRSNMRIENPATVTLFVDDSAEAVQARQALDENKIDYRVLPADGPEVPGIEVDGEYYGGLQQIESLAVMLADESNGLG